MSLVKIAATNRKEERRKSNLKRLGIAALVAAPVAYGGYKGLRSVADKRGYSARLANKLIKFHPSHIDPTEGAVIFLNKKELAGKLIGGAGALAGAGLAGGLTYTALRKRDKENRR